MNNIFLIIICSIFNYLPFNMREHIYMLNNIFNSTIFNSKLIYITPLFMIPVLLPKNISFQKKYFKKTINYIKLLCPIVPILIIKIFFKISIKSFICLSLVLILTSIILLFYKVKLSKEISYLKIFFINLLCLIPGISILYTFLWSIKNYDIKNKYKIAIGVYIIESLIYIKEIEFNVSVLIGIIIGLFTTYISYIFFKDKKIWKIAIYSIVSAIFYIVFFR